MSDYFFYDLNKKMADLADKQQLTENAAAAPVTTASSVLRTQLNERDLGKHNNATTGFAALAKKTGGGEKGARIAGAQLAKMRAKGQVEESGKPDFLDLDKDGNRKEPMKSAARSAKKDMDEGFMDTVKKGYNKVTNTLGDIGIIPPELLSPRRDKNGNWNKRTNTARNNFIDWIEENPGLEPHQAELLANFDKWVDDGNSDRAAGKQAVEMWKQRMKREKQSVSEPMRRHSMTEVDATPQHVDDWTPPAKPATKASAPKPPVAPKPAPKKPKMYPPQAIDDPVKEAAKWRHPKYKNRLYTQKKGDSDDYDDMDYGYDDYGIKKRPANDPGQKRRMGGVGDEFSRTDPLEKGFGRSGTGSPVEKGPRKGLPKRDQITSLKQSIKDVHGRHPEPNLPEGGANSSLEQKIRARLDKLYDKMEPEYAIEKVAQQFGMSQEELQHKLAHGFNKKFDKNMD